jgi:serine/threonine-protein kinase HipA
LSQHILTLFDAAAEVGRIGYDSLEEAFTFSYADTWRAAAAAYPLSPHFPLRGDSPGSSTVRRFIENLLPEGRALDIVTVTHQVSRNNVFGLIRELGRETAGALTFLAEGEQPKTDIPTQLREIPREELRQRIASRAEIPFSVWDGRVRMSIAGYQDKLPVYMEGERLFLAEGPLASTHILKPEPAGERLPQLVANEHFCLRLAQHMRLPVPQVSILRLPEPVLVVERFDRERQADRVRRLHVIDACQALDFPVSYKYERNLGSGPDVRHIRDGVSFRRLFSVAGRAAQKAVATQTIARWALLQFLIGNSDAHGKNISFFCRRDGLVVAPFYDLVSVVQYKDVEHGLAMAFGDEFALEKVKPFDLASFASETGIARAYLFREMMRMATSAAAGASKEERSPAYVEEERARIADLASFVREQARRLRELARPMLQIDAALL